VGKANKIIFKHVTRDQQPAPKRLLALTAQFEALSRRTDLNFSHRVLEAESEGVAERIRERQHLRKEGVEARQARIA
jgi:hypothetical protein